MRYYARRKNYAAMPVHLSGGGALQGMDTTAAYLPPERAALAEHLWRDEKDCVCKRPGYHPVEAMGVDGTVLEVRQFAGQRLIHYVDKTGQGWLRRQNAAMLEDRPVPTPLTFLPFGTRLLALTPGEWLVLEANGRVYALCEEGIERVDEKWDKATRAKWSIDQTLLTVPLIRCASSPTGEGLNIQPPNDLIPLVQESFVYAASHQEMRRNRFCMQYAPDILGDLPVDAEGTPEGLSDADKAVRIATLKASAILEIRQTQTDAYGNVSDKWVRRSWKYNDNISSADKAFWINDINKAALAFDGDDNVRITYFIPRSDQRDRAREILNARCYTLYGVNGRKDRLFAATENTVFYSALEDPLYCSHLQSIVLGQDEVGIRILSGEDLVLTVLADTGAWRIVGNAESEVGEYALDAYFSISLRLPCPRPMGRRCVIAGGELLFYSDQGLCAVTPSGVLDERCIQLRSRRLEGVLQQEAPEDIRMYSWKNWLLLAGQKGLYLFDLQRRIKVSGDAYSTHGYEGYCWPDITIDSFAEDAALAFYRDGWKYAFDDDPQDERFYDEYYRNGVLMREPVRARWKSGVLGWEKEGCKHVAGMTLHVGGPTAVRIVADGPGGEHCYYDYSGAMGQFRYGKIRYGQWYYGGCPKTVCRFPLSLRHRQGWTLTISNDVPDQPFRLQTLILEYQ